MYNIIRGRYVVTCDGCKKSIVTGLDYEEYKKVHNGLEDLCGHCKKMNKQGKAPEDSLNDGWRN